MPSKVSCSLLDIGRSLLIFPPRVADIIPKHKDTCTTYTSMANKRGEVQEREEEEEEEEGLLFCFCCSSPKDHCSQSIRLCDEAGVTKGSRENNEHSSCKKGGREGNLFARFPSVNFGVMEEIADVLVKKLEARRDRRSEESAHLASDETRVSVRQQWQKDVILGTCPKKELTLSLSLLTHSCCCIFQSQRR